MSYLRPTQRQKEVLAAYVESGTFEAAAVRLGIAPGTARMILSNARRRCGFSTAQLVAYGIRDGWLEIAYAQR